MPTSRASNGEKPSGVEEDSVVVVVVVVVGVVAVVAVVAAAVTRVRTDHEPDEAPSSLPHNVSYRVCLG